jgi:2,3-diketo-5-methylthio-1-phosphopentane phosphatase
LRSEKKDFFVAIDFDGTVTDVDIIDAILQTFAAPEWRDVEALWEQGIIGSMKCLETQMSLIDQPLGRLLDYIDRFTLDESFKDFVLFLDKLHIPYAILSDGFQVFIERLLSNAGLKHVPVYANILTEEKGCLKTFFPFSRPDCSSANCKCAVAEKIDNGLPVILIGDGRSDFCVAEKACCAFTKNKLTGYCSANKIPHSPFHNFKEIAERLKTLEGSVIRLHKERILNAKKAASPAL